MESRDAYSYGENWQHPQAQKVGEDWRSQNLQGLLPRFPHVVCPGPRFFATQHNISFPVGFFAIFEVQPSYSYDLGLVLIFLYPPAIGNESFFVQSQTIIPCFSHLVFQYLCLILSSSSHFYKASVLPNKKMPTPNNYHSIDNLKCLRHPTHQRIPSH